MISDVELKWLQYCLDLARKGEGFTSPNPMVGAVMVRDREMLAACWHAKSGEDHAERRCLNLIDSADCDDVLYVSLEPCCFEGKTPACTDIILSKGVKKVVVGMRDPDSRSRGQGIQLLRDNGVEVCCLQDELGIFNFQFSIFNEFSGSNDQGKKLLLDLFWLNRGFISRVERERPWVTVKCAVSVDGFVALDDRDSTGCHMWITGEESRSDVHKERGKYDAIVAGSGTVRMDNPSLTTHGKNEHQPRRVVLGGDIPKNSKVLNDEFKEKTIVVSGQKTIDPHDIRFVLQRAFEEGWSMVYVEGGPKVWRSFLDSGLVDQIDWYESPDELGSGLEVGFDPIVEQFGLLEELEFGLDTLRRWVR
jgi:diaminohydroxyphosphoribosylaminopyrimidine deaminase / 5-amino-6-(5-phosphoribosylamino)uracil reductase